MVGADCVFHGAPAQVRGSAVVACHRCGNWPGSADQVCDRLLHCGNSSRARLHARAPLLREPLVLGGGGAGAADFSAESRLARAPRLHLLPLPPAHSRARCGRRPRQGILEGPVPDLHQPGHRTAVDCGAHRLPARAALPHAGADVPGSFGAVRRGPGARLLHGRRVPHAAGHGRGDGRELARFPAPLGPAVRRNGLLRGLCIRLSVRLCSRSAAGIERPAQAVCS